MRLAALFTWAWVPRRCSHAQIYAFVSLSVIRLPEEVPRDGSLPPCSCICCWAATRTRIFGWRYICNGLFPCGPDSGAAITSVLTLSM